MKKKTTASTQTSIGGIREPESLFQLFIIIIKQMVKTLPKRIVIILVIGLVSFLLHTYLVIYPNGGFAKGTNAFFDNALGLVGNRVKGTAFWTITSYLIVSLLRKTYYLGIKKIFHGIVVAPVRTFKSFIESPKKFLGYLSIQGLLVLLAAQLLIKNTAISSTLIAGSIVAIILFSAGLSYHVIRLGYKDAKRIVKRITPFKDSYFDSFHLSVIISLIVFLSFQDQPFMIYGIMILFLITFILTHINKKNTATINFFLLGLSVIHLSLLFMVIVYADDGGVQEAGGFIAWLTSQGAGLAVLLGLPPSLGAMLGSLLGLVSGELSWDEFATDFDEMKEDMSEFFEEASETIQDGIESLYDDLMIGISSLFGGPSDNPNVMMQHPTSTNDCYSQGLPSYWINTSSLNLVIIDRVFKSKGLGPSVEFTLTYNSNNLIKGAMGIGWVHNYETILIHKMNTIAIKKPSAQIISFSKPETLGPYPINYLSDDATYDHLFEYADCWLFENVKERLFYQYEKSNSGEINKLIGIMDRNEHTIRLNYDADNRLHQVVDATNRPLTINYNGQGYLSTIEICDGREAMYKYNDQGLLTETIDMQEIPCLYKYDDQGIINRMIVGSRHYTTQFLHKDFPWGKGVTSIIDSEHNETTFKLVSNSPRKIKQIDAVGNSTIYTSNNGLTEIVEDAKGLTETSTYLHGLMTRMVSKNNGSYQMTYDHRGNLIKRINALGYTQFYEYDQRRNLIKQSDDEDVTYTLSYDQRSNLKSIVNPLGESYRFEHDEQGQLSRIVSPGDIFNDFLYDSYGNMILTTNALQEQVTYKYDAFGYSLEAIIDAKGNETSYVFDNNHRLLSIKHPDGSHADSTYNCCVLMSQRDENGVVQHYERNKRSDKTKIIDRLGNITTFRRDPLGRKTSVMNSKGDVMAYEYGLDGHISKLITAYKEVTFDYQQGLLSRVEDADGSTTQFAYDLNGLLTTLTDPTGEKTSYVRDRSGILTQQISPNGHLINYEYNVMGQVTKMYDLQGLLAKATYNKRGLVKEHWHNPNHKTQHTYDPCDRIKTIIDGQGKAVSYQYDMNGNVTTLTYNNGLVVTYTYNSRNHLTNISWNQHWVTLNVDAVGRLVGIDRSNGANTLLSVNEGNLITDIKHIIDKPGTANEVFTDIAYSYDSTKNLVEEKGLWPLDKKIEETDSPNNYQYNLANQLMASEDDQFFYDDNGNLTEVKGKNHVQYTYDSLDRLSSITTKDSDQSFDYNALGYRVKDISNGVTTYHVFGFSGQLLMSYGEDESNFVYYIYAGNQLVARVDDRGNAYFYHFDNHGSTLAITNETAQIVATYAYAPFGQVTYGDHLFKQPFTYVGAFGVMDDGHHLLFMKSRTYDASIGRFLQRDHTGIYGGLNLYAYVENNPMSSIDPEGTIGTGVLEAMLVACIVGLVYTQASEMDFNGYQNTRLAAVNRYIDNVINNDVKPGLEALYEAGYENHNVDDFLKETGDKLAQIGKWMTTLTGAAHSELGYALGGFKTALFGALGEGKEAASNFIGGLPSVGNVWTFLTESWETTKTWADKQLNGDNKSNCD